MAKKTKLEELDATDFKQLYDRLKAYIIHQRDNPHKWVDKTALELLEHLSLCVVYWETNQPNVPFFYRGKK